MWSATSSQAAFLPIHWHGEHYRHCDYRIRWQGGQYDMSAFCRLESFLQGDRLAMSGSRRLSSRRYYQRPNADYVTWIRVRLLFGRLNIGINHSKLSGKHWLWDVDLCAGGAWLRTE